MKEGWTYKKLGEVASFARGLTYSKNDEVEQSNNIVLRSNNIDLIAGKLDFSELKYLRANYVIPEEKRLRKGSLFICMSNGSKAHLGKVAYVDKDYGYAFGGFMGQITPNKDVDGLYLHYELSSPLYKEYIKSLSEGANINNLKYKDLAEFVVKYPPLPEQQSIVDYLDSAFAKIDAMKANTEKALNEAKALFQASLKEMLEPKEGWEKKTIEHFAKIVHGKNQKEVLDDNGLYPIYGSGGNIMGYANAYLCDAGTTILGRKGTIDNPLFIEEKFWNVDTAFGIIAKGNCNKKFLYYSIKKIDWAKLNTGTTLPSLTQNVVYNVEMSAPPLSEQQSIVATLDSLKSKVDRLQENYDKISQECDALKQAILRQVFE